jgi:hypothetical protein
MNEKWLKIPTDQIPYRVEMLEKKVDKMEEKFVMMDSKLDSLTILVTTINTKLDLRALPGGAPGCVLHNERLNQIELENKTIRDTMRKLNTKVLLWSGGLVVIGFLLSGLVFPYVLSHFRVETADDKVKNSDAYVCPTNDHADVNAAFNIGKSSIMCGNFLQERDCRKSTTDSAQAEMTTNVVSTAEPIAL